MSVHQGNVQGRSKGPKWSQRFSGFLKVIKYCQGSPYSVNLGQAWLRLFMFGQGCQGWLRTDKQVFG